MKLFYRVNHWILWVFKCYFWKFKTKCIFLNDKRKTNPDYYSNSLTWKNQCNLYDIPISNDLQDCQQSIDYLSITERSDFRKTKLSNFDFYFLRLMMVLLGRYFTCVYKVAATDRGPAIRRHYSTRPIRRWTIWDRRALG